VQRSKLEGIRNWGRNRDVKTNWLLCLSVCQYCTVIAAIGKNSVIDCYDVLFSVGRVIPGIIKSTVSFVMDLNGLSQLTA